jgi:ABC-type multidrug transport system fused ATPase/permease subunit
VARLRRKRREPELVPAGDRAAFDARRRASEPVEEDIVVQRDPDGDEDGQFKLVRLRTLAREEREKLREELRAQRESARPSTAYVTKRLARFAVPQWKAISFGFILLVLRTAMDLVKPLPLAYSIDSVVNQNDVGTIDMETVVWAGVIVVLIQAAEGLFGYVNTMVVTKAARTMTRDIRAAMFDHVQRLSLQFHSKRRSGDLLMRVSNDVGALQTVFTSHLIDVLNSAVFLTGMLVIIFIIDWQIGLLTLAMAVPLYFFVRRFSSDIRDFTRAQRAREGSLASLFHEALGTTRLNRVFNRERHIQERFEEESAMSLELGMQASLREERFSWTVDLLGSIITGAVLILATYKAQQGLLGIGDLFLLFYYARMVYRPVRTGIKNASRIWRAMAPAERIIELLDQRQGVVDRRRAKPAPPFAGEIEFRDVHFRYEDQPVLDGISVKLPAHRVTAVVGPTGAGKTTLVSLVPRLFDPDGGEILIDGHDIREYQVESVRDQISVVLQESTLLYASIAENIGYGRLGVDFSEIEAAAWLAGVHDFIMDLPQGYATQVGERGDTLSGGQKQLISIARAIVRDAPIVILDEPMTGLDPSSAAQVGDALERLMQNKTVLFITHNLALVENADYCIVVDGGKVLQQGTPKELREQDGLFKELFKAQAETDRVFAATT